MAPRGSRLAAEEGLGNALPRHWQQSSAAFIQQCCRIATIPRRVRERRTEGGQRTDDRGQTIKGVGHCPPPVLRPLSSSLYRQPPVRITWISRSRIFLRRVLRLTPSKSAARIWLPR